MDFDLINSLNENDIIREYDSVLNDSENFFAYCLCYLGRCTSSKSGETICFIDQSAGHTTDSCKILCQSGCGTESTNQNVSSNKSAELNCSNYGACINANGINISHCVSE